MLSLAVWGVGHADPLFRCWLQRCCCCICTSASRVLAALSSWGSGSLCSCVRLTVCRGGQHISFNMHRPNLLWPRLLLVIPHGAGLSCLPLWVDCGLKSTFCRHWDYCILNNSHYNRLICFFSSWGGTDQLTRWSLLLVMNVTLFPIFFPKPDSIGGIRIVAYTGLAKPAILSGESCTLEPSSQAGCCTFHYLLEGRKGMARELIGRKKISWWNIQANIESSSDYIDQHFLERWLVVSIRTRVA